MKIRIYSKQELAVMYLPDLLPKSAVNRLTIWIKRCTPLMQQLISTGYTPTQRYYTPRQVSLIVEYLGEP